MEKTRISSIQLFLLLIGFLFGSTVIISPASSARNDAWLAILLAGLGGALLMGMYVAIALLNPSKTLVEILREKLGKVIGNIIAVLYIWYFIHLASLVFRNFGDFICTVTFPETPMVVVISLFAVVLIYAINSGIEVISRMSELLVPLIPLTSLVLSLALITIHDFTAFLPILENGVTPVLNAAFNFVSFPIGETIVFLMIFPHLNKKKSLKKITFYSLFTFIIINLWIFYRNISVLGSDLMSRVTFIPHNISMLIPELNVEPLIDIDLLIGGGVKISICIYGAVKGISQVAGIGDYRNFTLAVTTFCVVLSIWVFENILEMFQWADFWPYYSIPFQLAIPLLLLILSLKRG